jgi:adenylyltransferase/sulfurtransferase
MKILVGAKEINRDIIVIDVWEGTLHRFKISPRQDCPTCQGKYEFLQGKFGIKTTTLCGQNAVQVSNPEVAGFSLKELATHLESLGEISYNEFMLRFIVGNHEMVVFPDGRAILKNSNDESLARGLYAKYIGT